MNVSEVSISEIIPYARNPRDNAAAVSGVAGSIAEFGFRQPIVVDEHNVIVIGHTRLKAAQQLGMEKVPVHVAKGLTKAQLQALRLADNRLNENAKWVDEMLGVELTELAELGADLSVLGFSEDELAGLLHQDNEGLTDEDVVPEAPDDPVTVIGDVWLLGNHRLMCGDSTKADDVKKLLNGVTPHLMVTDPPYGVEYDPNQRKRIAPNMAERTYMAASDDKNTEWSEVWALFPGSVAYVWHSDKQIIGVGQALIAAGFELRQQIIWAKNHLTITRTHFHYQHEHCWYAVKKGKSAKFSGPKNETTLWKIDKVTASTGHGAQKPVECMKRPIENNSSPGQAVYEPFSGSGTTIIAGEKIGRHVYAMEISPTYVDVAVRRWEEYTGQKADRCNG